MSARVAALAAAGLLLALAPRVAEPASPGQAAADRGAALYRAGDYRAARDAFREAVRRDPGLVRAWDDLGWAERRLGNDAEALRIWRNVLRLEPGRAETAAAIAGVGEDSRRARVRAVRDLFARSRIAEARRLATDLATSYPGDVQAQHLLAHALTKSRDHPAAARQWRRALDLDPGSAVARENWIRSLYEAGEADEAVRQGRSLAAASDAPPAVLRLLAEDAAVQGRFAEAASWYRTLTERFPDEPQHWRDLSLAYGELGRTDEQLAVTREALGRMPERLDLRIDLASLLADAGRWEEALAHGRRLVREYPDKPAVHRLLLSALAETGRADEALSELSAVHPSFLKDYEVRMLEAKVRSDSGDLPAARGLLDGLSRPDPDRRFVPVLLYHGVAERERTRQISASRFDDQMRALAGAGYTAITLSELARMVDGTSPFPRSPVLITFDDARTDAFELGDPVLARHGLKATMFVPSGPLGDEDAFHAGWRTLARHERSGRWELQSHGHAAHTRVAIDREGRRGEFLVYRAWLEGLGRRETFEEYVDRIDRDLVRSRRELERRFPGRPILGFAYPLNEIGPSEASGAGAALFVNETISRRHFRFGLVQDRTGYNELRHGEAPFMLRRFEVPRDWSGAQLLAHLAANEPRRAGRVALAQLTLDHGRPAAARAVLEEIEREEPLAAAACERVLADVAWEEERPREAARHLAAGSPSRPAAPSRGDSLAWRLAWANEPAAGARTAVVVDTDRRSVVSAGARFRQPLRVPVELELEAGRLWFTDRRHATRSAGLQVSAAAAAQLGVHLGASGWARHRDLSGAPRSLSGGLEARLRLEQHRLALGWSREDVEAALALAQGIASDRLSAGYGGESARWRVEVSGARLLYEDGNRRSDLHASALARSGLRARWALGASIDYESSVFAPAEYYAPRELVEVAARTTFSRRWSDSSAVAADVRLGAARDLTHALRPAARAGLRFSRWWGSSRSLATSLGLTGAAVPGYGSLGATLGLEWRP